MMARLPASRQSSPESVLVEASNLPHANLEGIDRGADFADDRSAALVPAG